MSRRGRRGDPAGAQHRRTLFRSAGISVISFRCTANEDKDGPEELNSTHSMAFIRRGLFRRTHHGRSVIADSNHILFFNANQAYRYAHPAGGGDDCTILTIAASQAVELAARHAPRGAGVSLEQPFALGHGLATPRTARLHFELLHSVQQGLPALTIEDVLADLTDAALRAAQAAHGIAVSSRSLSARARRWRRELVEETKLAFNRRLDHPPTLEHLAAAFGCSRFHLSRAFHAEAGLSLRQYLNRLRASAAAHELAAGRTDLTTLALELGYSDHSHFTNAFRAEWGVPPSAFRARHRRS